MAEFIKLAQFDNHNKAKRLTAEQKTYIDDNYKYDPIATLAKDLNLHYNDISNYCSKMRYNVTKIKRTKPKKLPKEATFDVDNYKTWTV